MFNKKYKEKIQYLEDRVEELENIICPNSHTWVVNANTIDLDNDMSCTFTEHRCSKCNKIL